MRTRPANSAMSYRYVQNLPNCTAFAILFGAWVLMVGRTARAGETNELFIKNCASCHGKDGRADSFVARKLGVKDLSQSKLNDQQIEQQIREGRPADQNTAKMPAFKDRLTEEEIKSLIPVVKEFRTQPKQESEVTR